MKLQVLLAFATLSLVFNSCSKDDPGVGAGVGGAQGNVVVATINGMAWGAADGYARLTPNFGLEIHGTHGSTSNITLVVSPYNGLQTYQLNGITKIIYTENGVNYTSTTGQITVSTDNDQFVEGIFNCEMISNTGSLSLSFTGGQFKAIKQ